MKHTIKILNKYKFCWYSRPINRNSQQKNNIQIIYKMSNQSNDQIGKQQEQDQPSVNQLKNQINTVPGQIQGNSNQNRNENNAENPEGPKSQDVAVQQQIGVQGVLKWPVRILSFLFICGTIAVNYVVGGSSSSQSQSIGAVSDRFSLWVTPPGLFFSIWIVIYCLLFVANLYTFIMNTWPLKAHIFFAITNLFNILWVVIFNIGTEVAVYIAFLIIVPLAVFILLTWVEIGNIPQDKFNFFTYLGRNIFAFYLGWVLGASNLNFGIILHYWWGASKQAQMIVFWIMAPLCAIGATLLNTGLYRLRGFLSCVCLWISVTWAFVGAAITSDGCVRGIIQSC